MAGGDIFEFSRKNVGLYAFLRRKQSGDVKRMRGAKI